MASLPSSRRVTYEEWLRLPEVDDAIEEVVNGEIRIMPPPKWKHAEIVRRIRRLIEARLDEREAIAVDSSFGLVIRKTPLTSRVPDLAVFRTDRIQELDGYIHSAPQLAVEVLSPANTRREMQEKLADYESLGVPEVWLVSPEARSIEVLQLDAGQLQRTGIYADGVLKPMEFPDVEVVIARIWPD
jgi:Uma2 family endonuclease